MEHSVTESLGSLILYFVAALLPPKFNCMVDRVDIIKWVAPESNNTQNGLKFKKRVQVTTMSEVAAYFLLITYARPPVADPGSKAPWRGGAKGFSRPLSIVFNLRGHVAIRC